MKKISNFLQQYVGFYFGIAWTRGDVLVVLGMVILAIIIIIGGG